jgi:hypothetical protein
MSRSQGSATSTLADAPVSTPVTATPPATFNGFTAIRDLFRVHPAPPGWWRATVWILACNAVLIALLIWLGLLFFNDPHEMFRERRPGTFATVAALVCSGIVSFKIRRRVIDWPVAAFWLALGIMMCVAGADDLLTIHEHVDKYFHRITGLNERNPVTDHIDDVLVASYVLPAFYLALRHCKRLLAVPFTIQVLAVAFGMFAVHLVFDWLGLSPTAEECIKQTAACVIWIALLATLLQPTLPASWET